MAIGTPNNYRNLMFYQVYLRNHNQSGTFKELEQDLERIKGLGTDILYLLPINPVGKKNRKGSLGCNYSISDYRSISDEHGTKEDFVHFIHQAHKNGLKVMLDIVFHHTAHDAVLLKTHPEFYFYRNGKNVNKVGDWSDIIDFDFNQMGLWDELIDTLNMFARLGVDGYRCDVASAIPLDFWLRARKEVNAINPDFIWVAESVHPGFIKTLRDHRFTALSDSEVFQAFDILYDYDIHDEFIGYLKGNISLKEYIQAIKRQETIYPDNYVKLRNLENHDQERIASYYKNDDSIKQLTAFIFFLKGATMIYAGEEAYATHRPSLFEIDKVDWSMYPKHHLDELIQTLAKLKKDSIMATGNFTIDAVGEQTVLMSYQDGNILRIGIFNIGLQPIEVAILVPDGVYENRIDSSNIEVTNGKVVALAKPIILDYIKN